MDTKSYPPLVLLSASLQPGKEFTTRKKQFMNAGVKGADKLTVKSYIDLFYSPLFMVGMPHPFMDVDRLFLLNVDTIIETTGFSKEELFANNKAQLITEIKDLYLAPVLIEEWSKAKQVYKPDRDFAKALLKTTHLQITKDTLNHLPYNYFYIDVMDCDVFDPIVGMFVFVTPLYNNDKNVGADITIYLLTKDLIYFSHYSGGYYDKNDIISFDLESYTNDGYTVWNKDSEIVYSPDDFKVDRNEVSLFALQMLCYLSSEEPQITESELTKHTYIKRSSSARVKNKWNEVNISEVGITYGNNYRKKIKEYEEGVGVVSGTHRSPVPHMRSAHWHRHWVGKGRTELKIKWHEPTFVAGKESKNITIRKVEE